VFGRNVADVQFAFNIAANDDPMHRGRFPAANRDARLRVGWYVDDGTFVPCAAAARAVAEARKLLRLHDVDIVDVPPPDGPEAFELFMRATTADGGAHLKRILTHSKIDPAIGPMLMAVSARPMMRAFLAVALRASRRKRMASMLPWFSDHSADGYFQTVERIHDFRAAF